VKLRALLVLLVSITPVVLQQSDTPRTTYAEARLAFNRGNDDQALSLARRGLTRFGNDDKWRELFTAVAAESLTRTGETARALAEIDAAPHSGDPEAAVRRLMARGYARLADGADDYRKAAVLSAKVIPSLRGEIALRRATPAFWAGDNDAVERFAHEALDHARADDQPYVVVNAHGMLANAAMKRGEYQRAIEHFDRGMRMARATGAQSALGRMLGNSGWCFMQLGDTEQAKASLEKSVLITRQTRDVIPQTAFLGDIAGVLIALQHAQEALPYAQESVEVARKLGKLQLAMALTNQAQVEIELGDFSAARMHNDEARTVWPEAQSDRERRYTLLNAARIDAATGNRARAMDTLTHLAESSEDLPLRWNAQSEMADLYAREARFADAERMYEAALDTGEVARADEKSDDAYLFAFESLLIRFYDKYIDFLLLSGRIKDALHVAERSRARTLLGGRRSAGFDPVALARAHDATILSYWFTPQRSLLWVVTPDAVELIELPSGSEIDRGIDRYREEITTQNSGIESTRGAALFQTLIKPALSHTKSKRFIVIPDGHMGAIALESLITAETRPHYWIEDATVSYAPSLALIPSTRHHNSFRDARALVIGDVPAQGVEFPALALARSEIADVARHFNSERCQVVTGVHATRAAYLEADLGRLSYVHFVAHGTASVRTPLESSVVLAGGPLSADQIIHAPMRADLVTVSSCNSTGRRTYVGEGPVGLAWAFLRAGARRVISSQWDVSDRATSKMMDRMYSSLEKGRDHADALREAKLELVRSGGKYSRPFYWAPFILYGAP
jgi:CHAT domain-containing protein/Tfp pilus assembly protein PilF